MNILIILPSLKNQAPIKIGVSIANGLLRNGHQVDVIYFDLDVDSEIKLKLDSSILRTKVNFFDSFDCSKYDIVHSHLFRSDLFLAKNTLFNKKTKTVTTIHNYLYQELANYYNKFVSLFFGLVWNISWTRFDALSVLTNDACDYYRKYSFNKKIYRVYNGHDIVLNYDSLDSTITDKINKLKKSNKYVLGAYCNLIKRKNIDVLIKHVYRVKKSSLIIFGDGVEKENLIKLVKALNIEDRVLFFDATINAHQYNCFFDLFCMPSCDEGFGLSLIEAALHKTKILCSNIPVFKEIFPFDEVVFFELGDELSLDSAIYSALSQDVSDKAYLRAVEMFSSRAMIDNYISLYEKLLRD